MKDGKGNEQDPDEWAVFLPYNGEVLIVTEKLAIATVYHGGKELAQRICDAENKRRAELREQE